MTVTELSSKILAVVCIIKQEGEEAVYVEEPFLLKGTMKHVRGVVLCMQGEDLMFSEKNSFHKWVLKSLISE